MQTIAQYRDMASALVTMPTGFNGDTLLTEKKEDETYYVGALVGGTTQTPISGDGTVESRLETRTGRTRDARTGADE